MIFKKKKALVFLAALLFVLTFNLHAELMNPICRFKNVSIPVDLRIEGSILAKGTYDLEFLRYPSPILYYLRIMKKGKILHLLQGEEFPYDNSSVIPRKPQLKMSKNSAEKRLTLVFESGTDTKIYERARARYHIEYVEE
ncbi:MAG: hypothetical protein NTW95_08180 [Candidatus Aminicenantes bacterium]|nr:hypothetical protein [Candidatus Aminicenantes bacterium]